MKRSKSLVSKLLTMITITACVLALLITAAGGIMIYNSGINEIESELEMYARTLANTYDAAFHGDYYLKDNQLYKGDMIVEEKHFNKFTAGISCPSNVDFSLFWGEKRMFTTIMNTDGKLAIGTKASDVVIENVISGGQEYCYQGIMINGEYYMGYYIPIMNSSAQTVGMYFAGKPLDTVITQSLLAVLLFIAIAFVILLVSTQICRHYLKHLVCDLEDIKEYLECLSDGDFTAKLRNGIVMRTDEIGEIGSHAEKVCNDLRDMVERDPLTGLLNRRSCRRKIDTLHSDAVDYTVVMGDIDYFKKINDGYGHAAGDMVLKKISLIISENVPENTGIVSRWGGEEFLIVYPNMNIEQVKPQIENIMEIIRSSVFEYEDKQLKVTMTFGASEHQANENADKCINRADMHLYKGKQSGRNRLETD